MKVEDHLLSIPLWIRQIKERKEQNLRTRNKQLWMLKSANNLKTQLKKLEDIHCIGTIFHPQPRPTPTRKATVLHKSFQKTGDMTFAFTELVQENGMKKTEQTFDSPNRIYRTVIRGTTSFQRFLHVESAKKYSKRNKSGNYIGSGWTDGLRKEVKKQRIRVFINIGNKNQEDVQQMGFNVRVI